MAKKFLVPIDLNQLELQNVRLQNLASAPASPVIGQVYFNTTTNKAMCWDGTNWIPWEVGASVSPATDTPLMDGTAAVGTSLKYAREDHVHPTDTALYDLANGKSTVSYVQNLASGTAIGTITINGTTITIYAPTPTGQVQADWTEADSTAASYIQNKPNLATVATTGSYTDLSNRPTLGTAAAKGVDTSISSGSTSTNLPTTAAVVNYVSAEIGAADAMRFKGTIGTGGTVTALPSTHQIGDTYRVITAGTYAGQTCEVGDLIIALTTSGTTANDWTVAQTNIDGAITSITGTSPISVTGSGSSRTVSHEASGVTAGSYGDSGAQTPSFGGTFKALYATVNATGHVTGISAHDVTIPNTAASTSSAGIVQLNNTVTSTSTSQAATANAVKTAYDRAEAAYALAAIPDTITTTTTIAAGQTSGTATAPSSGSTRYKHGSYTARIGNDEIVLDASINESTHVTTYSIASAIASDITIITVWVLN